MSVIERAERRLAEEERQHELGADNRYDLHYWAAYLDGARAQKKEGGELAMSALNYVERQGFVTGMGYAGMTAEERETLLKELRNLHVGPVAPLVVEHDYAKLVEALRCKRDDCEGCDLAFFDNDEGWICQYAAKDDDAADAIEALQANVADKDHLIQEQTDEIQRLRADVKRQQEKMIELAKKLPKRGEIVRCGECKHHLPETERTNPYCNRFHCMKPDDWFCADGEM